MELKSELLEDCRDQHNYSENFLSCWNARGIYNSMQFSLKLRPDVYRKINEVPSGVFNAGELDFETLQAFSTYLHETIHWWQHCGATLGLILSLAHPSQAHINHSLLKDFIKHTGPIKSINRYNLENAKHEHPNDDEFLTINRILNNFYDIEFFRRITINPQEAGNIVNNPYFECIGHSLEIAYASAISTLAATLDQNFDFLPDARKWEVGFDDCRTKKIVGFYYGSDVFLAPIGALHIFEGQARFSQLQYLSSSSHGPFLWEDFRKLKMLEGVYVEAFELFLNITQSPWPETIIDPLIGLFLLVCDISINPCEGFPFDIENYEDSILNIDPGHRFILACHAVREEPSLKSIIREYSKSEYVEATNIISEHTGWISPTRLTSKINTWVNNNQAIKHLLAEDETFEFSDSNMPIRVMFARFIRFNLDKGTNPEFFCWPGAHMAGRRVIESNLDFFLRHQSLFCNSPDSQDIFPRQWPQKSEKAVQDMFDNFYVWNVIYDLTRQWVSEDGEFDFWFSWLTSKFREDELKKWASDHFELIYGIRPEQFSILKQEI